jgi:hypothetical protein
MFKMNSKSSLSPIPCSTCGRLVKPHDWRIWLAILTCGSFVITGCGASIVEVRIVLELELGVTSPAGEPRADLEILLQDHGMPTKLWKPRRLPICTTDKQGLCHKVVSYGYGRSYWPWERARNSPELLRQFEIFAKHKGRLVSLGFLPIEDRRQVQGGSKVIFSARL